LATAALTLVLAPLLDEDHILNVALLYLLLTLLTSAVWGYAVGLFAAVLSDVLVNFFFLPPLHRVTVHEPENVAGLLIFLAVAVTGASMLALLRRQAAVATSREAEARILRDLAHEMALALTPQDALGRLCHLIVSAFQCEGCAVLQGAEPWRVVAAVGVAPPAALPRDEASIAHEAASREQIIGLGAPRRRRFIRGARPEHRRLLFVPFPAEARFRGVLRISGELRAPALIDQERLLFAFANEASLALDRVRLAEEAREAETLRQADEFKSVLLSSVSHDLRSPLTAIKAAVGNLRDDGVQWSPEDVRSFLKAIETQTDRLIAIVSDLLQISRLEGGAVPTEIEPVQVSLLLGDAVAGSRPATTGRELTIDAPEQLWVAADYGLLLQALGNLIDNAARYSVPGGGIHLAAEQAGANVRIKVSDEGPGIPSEDVPHVFEKFYRGVQSKRTSGTGLGLSIVQAMVELCGGSISVRSTSAGTEFTVVLPAAPAQ
jgi:two-component system sensor histidine kinase KdpD